MAAVELEFALNVIAGRLSQSYLSMNPFTLPTLIAGSTLNFRIRLVKPNPSGGFGTLSLIPLDGLSLTVGIGVLGTSLTSGTLTVDGNALAGAVPLNVAAITGLFGAVQEVDKTIEFRVNDGGLYQPVRLGVKIKNSVLASATIDPVAPEEGLSKTEAAQAYVPRDGGNNGQGFLMKNAAGDLFRIYMGNDKELHWELVV